MINKNNVQELWEIYESYRNDFYKNYYSDVECQSFEDYVENNVKKCNNCCRYVLEEDMGKSELAINDEICADCMQDGYGS